MSKRSVLAGLALLIPLTGLAQEGPANEKEQGLAEKAERTLSKLLADDLDARMRAWPTWASTRGDRRFDDKLADIRPEAHEARYEAMVELIRRVEDDLDPIKSRLSPASFVTYQLLAHELNERAKAHDFSRWQLPVSQLGGPQQSLPQLPDRLSFTTKKHRADYVKRLEAMSAYIDQTVANMRLGLKAKRTPPKVVMGSVADQALAQGTEGQAKDPKTHALYKPFAEAAEGDGLAARARELISQQIVPAFRRLGEFLKDEYVPACRDSIAASDGVDGPKYYQWRLGSYSHTSEDPEHIHGVGLKEVARIRAEMFAVIARSDFPRKDALEGDDLFKAFTTYLRSDSRFYHQSAEDLLNGYRALAKRVDAELPALFGKLPRTPYGVREMPAYIAPTSPTAYYYSGSLKNGKAGNFIANTHKLDQRPRYEMIPLTLHEAVPGHHLQIALAQEMKDVPEWRTLLSYTAFVEGWALYAERLGLEMGVGERGFYADPYDDFGRLSYEMWRAMRLVVDTGIHAKGWSRQQAIDYMLANSALTAENIEREVDRYIVWPGQAVAYKMGELKIRALRKKAEDALGERFDVRQFHDAVLGQGAVHLQLLERIIDRWIERVRQG